MAAGPSGISSMPSDEAGNNDLDLTFVKPLLECLHNMQQEEEMTDVTLKVGDVSIPCHKVVLAAASPYFRAMFASGMAESISGVVHLRGLDSEAVKLALEYMYTVSCNIDHTNVEKIVQTSDLMQLKPLKDRCDLFMAKEIDETNCLSLQKFARMYHLDRLTEETVKQTKVSFMQLATGEEILGVTQEELMELIVSDDLVVKTEDAVLEFVLKWVQHDLVARKSQLEEIMKHVRLSYCTDNFLSEVKSNELLQQKIPGLEFLSPMLSTGSSHGNQGPRISYWVPPELVLVGDDWQYGNDCDGISFYKLDENEEFNQFTSISKPPHKYSACAVPRGILVSGLGVHSNECRQYDLFTSSWKPVPNLLQGRCSHSSVYLDGKVYVIGGTTADKKHEPYAPNSFLTLRPACGTYLRGIEILGKSKWNMFTKLPEGLSNMACVIAEKKIYVLGGYTQKRFSRTTIELDAHTGEFEIKAPIPRDVFKRNRDIPDICDADLDHSFSNAVYHNGAIYITGLYKKVEGLRIYTPSTDTWITLTGPPCSDKTDIHDLHLLMVWRGRVWARLNYHIGGLSDKPDSYAYNSHLGWERSRSLQFKDVDDDDELESELCHFLDYSSIA